jgi:hypothetical protein
MSAANDTSTREERLAAKLRENLRRRKSQSRDMAREMGESASHPLPKREDGG